MERLIGTARAALNRADAAEARVLDKHPLEIGLHAAVVHDHRAGAADAPSAARQSGDRERNGDEDTSRAYIEKIQTPDKQQGLGGDGCTCMPPTMSLSGALPFYRFPVESFVAQNVHQFFDSPQSLAVVCLCENHVRS